MRYAFDVHDGHSIGQCTLDFETVAAMRQEAVRTLREIVRDAPLSTEARHFVVEVRPVDGSETCFRASLTFTAEVPG